MGCTLTYTNKVKKQTTWIEKTSYIGVKRDNIIQLQITLFQLFLDKRLLKKKLSWINNHSWVFYWTSSPSFNIKSNAKQSYIIISQKYLLLKSITQNAHGNWNDYVEFMFM